VSSLSWTAAAVDVQVVPVQSKRDLDEFIHLPWSIYKGNQNWVAPLFMIEKQRFSAKHNPFFRHADVQLFLARREGRTVGRISAQVDSEHIRYWHERAGFFGFFECENDPQAAGDRLGVRKTYKLYIGGEFPRTESGRAYEVFSARGEPLANACRDSSAPFDGGLGGMGGVLSSSRN